MPGPLSRARRLCFSSSNSTFGLCILPRLPNKRLRTSLLTSLCISVLSLQTVETAPAALASTPTMLSRLISFLATVLASSLVFCWCYVLLQRLALPPVIPSLVVCRRRLWRWNVVYPYVLRFSLQGDRLPQSSWLIAPSAIFLQGDRTKRSLALGFGSLYGEVAQGVDRFEKDRHRHQDGP